MSIKKFNSRRKTYYQIRQLSDELCKEHGLSVIEPGRKKGKTYKEWKADRERKSWKTQLKKDIDEVVKISNTYEEFIILIKDKGYEVKGEGLEGNSLKYISFKSPDQQRFIRGSLRSLGREYTHEEIRSRIEDKKLNAGLARQTLRPHQQDILKRANTDKALIDTSGDKFRNNPGLDHWAKIRNLQIAARSYAEAESLSDLQAKIDEKIKEESAARAALSALDRQLVELKELKYYLDQYKDNLPFHERYKKSKDPDRYMRIHETNLILFDGARRWLQQMGITPKMSLLNHVNADLEILALKQTDLEKRYKTASKEKRALKEKYNNITHYFGMDVEEHEQEMPTKADFKASGRTR